MATNTATCEPSGPVFLSSEKDQQNVEVGFFDLLAVGAVLGGDP
jgi:hypothetical protein